jgi:hypothetical protein
MKWSSLQEESVTQSQKEKNAVGSTSLPTTYFTKYFGCNLTNTLSRLDRLVALKNFQ